jgi:hypothetical protein
VSGPGLERRPLRGTLPRKPMPLQPLLDVLLALLTLALAAALGFLLARWSR